MDWSGSTVSNNINICGNSMVGAGSVAINDIEKAGIYVGVPAKEIEMSKHNLYEGGIFLLRKKQYKHCEPFNAVFMTKWTA